MKAQAILFVGSDSQSAERQWRQALLLTLGSEPALTHLARQVAAECSSTTLLTPTHLLPHLPPPPRNVTMHTYYESVGDSSLCDAASAIRGSNIIVIDASQLPAVDVQAALAAHRKSGRAMTVFFDCAEPDYCREQLATDPAGSVSSTLRRYTDSHSTGMQREPLAIVLSRSMFRPDEACQAATFAELVNYFARRVERAGEQVHWLRDVAVHGFRRPFDALLQLVHNAGGNGSSLAELDVQPGEGPAPRLLGPVQIGRNVCVGRGAVIIGPVAIGDNASIGPGAVLSHSIVLPGECIPASGHAHDRLVGRADSSICGDCHVASTDCNGGAKPEPASEREDPCKRAFDAVAAALALIVLSPLLLCVAILIKLTSPGPIFFQHRRQGRGGVEFNCIKFRTMVSDADALQQSLRERNEVDGPQFKLVHDPRVTRLGELLRRTNIDEIPQLWNVLLGQMSLVGPRPSPDKENQCCPPWRRARLSVRPGITGLWQVARSSDRRMTDFQEWIYYDTRYVEHRSFQHDQQIIWQTVRDMLHIGTSERWRSRWLPKPQLLPIPAAGESQQELRASA